MMIGKSITNEQFWFRNSNFHTANAGFFFAHLEIRNFGVFSTDPGLTKLLLPFDIYVTLYAI